MSEKYVWIVLEKYGKQTEISAVFDNKNAADEFCKSCNQYYDGTSYFYEEKQVLKNAQQAL